MRFLFSFTGGAGHFLPTVVFARALARRGHDIRYACQDSMVTTVEAAGFCAEPTGGASLLNRAVRRPLAPVDRDAEERAMARVFAGKAARERRHRLTGLIERWRPDLVVRDEVDFGAALAADVARLPHAVIVVIAAGRLTRAAVIEAPLAALRAELGLNPADTMEALHRYLLLVPVPPSFHDPQSSNTPRHQTPVRPDRARTCTLPSAPSFLKKAATCSSASSPDSPRSPWT